MKKFILLLLVMTFIISCDLQFQKRRYNRGYHIEWTHNKNFKNHLSPDKIPKDKIILSQVPNSNLLSPNSEANNSSFLLNSLDVLDITFPTPLRQKNTFASNQVNSKSTFVPKKTYKKEISLLKSKSSAAAYYPSKRRINSNANLAKHKSFSDYILYLLAATMGVFTFGLFRSNKTKTLSATRWANKNKWTSKVLITLSKLGLTFLGFTAGKLFYQSGHVFSETSQFAFGTLMLLGLFSMKWLDIKKKFMNFKQFYIKNISKIAIILSLFFASIGIGNRYTQHLNANTPIGYGIEKVNYSLSKDTNPVIESSSPMQKDSYTGKIIACLIFAIILTVVAVVFTCVALCAEDAALAVIPILAFILLIIDILIWASVIKEKNST